MSTFVNIVFWYSLSSFNEHKSENRTIGLVDSIMV